MKKNQKSRKKRWSKKKGGVKKRWSKKKALYYEYNVICKITKYTDIKNIKMKKLTKNSYVTFALQFIYQHFLYIHIISFVTYDTKI